MGQGIAFEPALHIGIFLNGVQFGNGHEYPLGDWSKQTGVAALVTASGLEIPQQRWIAGDAPINLYPLAAQIRWTFQSLAERYQVEELADSYGACNLWWDLPFTEMWSIQLRNDLTFKTARLLPWHLPGVDTATRPPVALIDDVAQTVIYSGSPGTGQVLVQGDLSGPSGPGTITIPNSSTGGQILKLRYPAERTVVIEGIAETYGAANKLDCTVKVREFLAKFFVGRT